MRLLVTRPSEDSAKLAATLAKHDISSLIEPMLEIVYPTVDHPALAGVQGILVTSANGIRAFANISAERDLAIWAVGPTSAQEARNLGFDRVHHASGDVMALVDLVCEHCHADDGTLLHVAGTHLTGDLGGRLSEAGYDYRRSVLYKARVNTGLSATAQRELEDGIISGVVLYSPRTAETFTRVISTAGLSEKCAHMRVFCLSEAVAEKVASLNWHTVVISSQPHEDSLIATVLRVAEST